MEILTNTSHQENSGQGAGELHGERKTVEGVTPELVLRPPHVSDGAGLWRFVHEVGALDCNSAYLYLMLCRNFAGTCVVAEQAGEIVGLATAYLIPDQPTTLFLWQIGVAGAARGQKLGSRMLLEILERPACTAVTHLETMVTPSNAPSRALFEALARRLGTSCVEVAGFPSALFPPQEHHESENLLRIGPFSRSHRHSTRSSHDNQLNDGIRAL